MIEYLFWLVFALLGFGAGWLVWGRGDLVAPSDAPRLGTVHAGPGVVWTGEGVAPFRVVTLDGEVRYEGISGAQARRTIEALRNEGAEWRAYRNGIPWDNGPR